jgi:hypothetical protein
MPKRDVWPTGREKLLILPRRTPPPIAPTLLPLIDLQGPLERHAYFYKNSRIFKYVYHINRAVDARPGSRAAGTLELSL